MATDINEVYKMFPCAKKTAEENIEFWSGEESDSDNFFYEWISDYPVEDDLYVFFEQLIDYDALLLRKKYITREQITNRYKAIQKLTLKHLDYFHQYPEYCFTGSIE